VAYLLESTFGIDLPKEMQREFGPIANDAVDSLGREVSAEELKSLFWREYIVRQEPYVLHHFHSGDTDGVAHCQARITHNNELLEVAGTGNGPIAAFVRALQSAGVQVFEVCDPTASKQWVVVRKPPPLPTSASVPLTAKHDGVQESTLASSWRL